MSPAAVATTVTQPTTTQELPNLFPDLGFKGAMWLKACSSLISALFLDLAKIACNQKMTPWSPWLNYFCRIFG